MNATLPLMPLVGMSSLTFIVISVVLGIAFGFFLERAGFGSAKNLSSIFILRDFRVFRVMFSAVVTAMLGIFLLDLMGIMNSGLLAYDPTFFWSMLAGGLLFGVGFYVGGYCPGTAAVAFARGRWDAAAFLFGITLGIYGFALLFDAVGQEAWFVSFFSPADATRQTLYGDGPVWPWVLGLTAVALVAFKVVPIVERRFALRTVDKERPEPPVIKGRLLTIGPALAGVAALVVVVLEVTSPEPALDAPRPSAAVDDDEALATSPLTVASWVIAEAHRSDEDLPPNAFIFDIREPSAHTARTIPGSTSIELGSGDLEARIRLALAAIHEQTSTTDKHKPMVLVDDEVREETLSLVRALRTWGYNATVLEEGFLGWEQQILDGDSPLFSLVFQRAPALTEQDEPSIETGELPEIDLAALNGQLRRWLAGQEEGLPPRLAFPGVVVLPTKAATIQASGGASGGCG